EIQIDRCPIHDLGNLISLVVIEKEIAVDGERAVKQGVLRAHLECIDIFRIERQRMYRLEDTPVPSRGRGDYASKEENRARRIGATCLVSPSVRTIDQCLIGKVELGRPIRGEASGPFLPLLVDRTDVSVAPAVGQQFAWN